MSCSADGKQLALWSRFDGVLGVWDVASGQRLVNSLVDPEDVRNVAWTSDGIPLALGVGGHAVKLWDIESGGDLFGAATDRFVTYQVTGTFAEPEFHVRPLGIGTAELDKGN